MSRIILPAAERSVQPWKNGGGKTIEIAASPPAAGLGDFDWRISTASVAVPGCFSHFDGVDRTLAVIEGRLELAFDGQAGSIELNAVSRPHTFPGDTGCFGMPIDGIVIDLNVMVRRGRWTGTIERIASPGTVSIVVPSQCAIILFVAGGSLGWRTDTVSLRPWDAIRIDGAAGESFALESDSAVYVIELAPRIA